MELRSASSDSLRFRIYEQLTRSLLDSSLEGATRFFLEWCELARRTEAWYEAGRCENIWGIAYLQRSILAEAATHFSRSIRYYQNIQETGGLGRAYNNLGITLRRQGRFKEAFLSFREALKYFQIANDPANIAMVYNNIAQIYYKYGQYGQALDYFTRYTHYHQTLNHPLELANGANNIGATYYELKDYTHALENYYRCYSIYDSLNHPLGLALASDNIGLMLRELGQIQDAISHHRRAVSLLRDSAHLFQLTMALGNLCTAHRLAGDLLQALDVGNEALQLADTHAFEELRTLLHEELALIFEARGELKGALSHAKACIEQLKESEQNKGQEQLIELSKDTHLLSDLIAHANNEQTMETKTTAPAGEDRVRRMSLLLFFSGVVIGAGLLWLYKRKRDVSSYKGQI